MLMLFQEYLACVDEVVIYVSICLQEILVPDSVMASSVVSEYLVYFVEAVSGFCWWWQLHLAEGARTCVVEAAPGADAAPFRTNTRNLHGGAGEGGSGGRGRCGHVAVVVAAYLNVDSEK